MRFYRFCLALLLGWASLANADGITLEIRGQQVTQRVFSLFVAPGEVLRLGLFDPETDQLRLQQDGKPFGEIQGTDLVLPAPDEPGLYRLELAHEGNGQQTVLNLFVGTPLPDGIDEIEGYRIGQLPHGHSRHPELYLPPRLYFRVTEENVDTQLSEHFTLRQFLCKQESGYPKFVVIQESLLVLLEGLIGAVREAGYPVDTFGIISAYRTPHYNRMIGNVPNSRHVYGDAMDFFVDLDKDGAMDDLNRDGSNNRLDVDLLYRIVDEYKQRPESQRLFGGVGNYYKTTRHGGFVHVDTRGYSARW